MGDLDTLLADAFRRVATAGGTAELEAVEREFLGRKGALAAQMERLRTLAPEERPAFGKQVNAAKNALTEVIERRQGELAAEESEARLASERLDVTLPGRAPAPGRRHPLPAVFDLVADALVGLGFEQVVGPEVEDVRYNFTALNFPEEHPALDEQMSFPVGEGCVLRTQTTALQGRTMPGRTPPFRFFTIGRCFRVDAVDATHYHTFHQVDAFAVDRSLSLADLKGTLAHLARSVFGVEAVTRFRPDFFPFVEPGAEISVRLPEGGWLEWGGAGMIHPNVLRHCGFSPHEWTGLAFGLGLDRIPIVTQRIGDIRLLFDNDLRLMEQLG